MSLVIRITLIAFTVLIRPVAGQTDPDFDRDVAPVLLSRCLECHQNNNPSGGLSLETAADQRRGGDSGPALINTIVYSEIAFACDRIEDADELLPAHLYDYRPIPREAAFLAARAHAAYRERGGKHSMILPDFLIGAHALVERCPLLTRDQRRYRQAFPGLKLITPAVA